MPQEEATINRSLFGPAFIGLLVGFAAAGGVSLLLLIGIQQVARAQPLGASSSQVYCGPWEIEGWFSEQGSGWAYWNTRWCYSPEVLGGWYKDYAGYSETPSNVTQSITPSADSVALGEPVTFHITQTNNAPYALASLRVNASLPGEFVSATPSQGGPCSYDVGQGIGVVVLCDLGTLPAGATAVLDVVMIPLERGTNQAHVLNGVAYSGSEDFLGAPLNTNDALTSVWVYSR